MLYYWLLVLEIKPPEGVIAPWHGNPGRPSKSETKLIYKTWVNLGQPSLFKNEVAKKFYGGQFTKAEGPERRRLRDRCRMAVVRVQKNATKFGL